MQQQYATRINVQQRFIEQAKVLVICTWLPWGGSTRQIKTYTATPLEKSIICTGHIHQQLWYSVQNLVAMSPPKCLCDTACCSKRIMWCLCRQVRSFGSERIIAGCRKSLVWAELLQGWWTGLYGFAGSLFSDPHILKQPVAPPAHESLVMEIGNITHVQYAYQ